MDVLYILIPLAIVLVAVAIGAFFLSVKSGQYDDLEGPGHRILMDDDDPLIPKYEPKKPKKPLRDKD